MITINYEGVGKFKFPQTWKEVTLDQFQKINQLSIEDEIDFELAMISILAGIPIDNILDLPVTEYKRLKEACSFINVNPDSRPKNIIEIDGVKYGYRNDVRKMKTSEYIDFDTMSASGVENMHIIMAILYRPIVKVGNLEKDPFDYEIEPYNSKTVLKRAEIFKEKMTMDFVLSATFFLMALVQSLLESTAASSAEQEALERKKKTISVMERWLKVSKKDGAGTSLFTGLRDRIKRTLKRG